MLDLKSKLLRNSNSFNNLTVSSDSTLIAKSQFLNWWVFIILICTGHDYSAHIINNIKFTFVEWANYFEVDMYGVNTTFVDLYYSGTVYYLIKTSMAGIDLVCKEATMTSIILNTVHYFD